MQEPDIWHCAHETTAIRRRVKVNGIAVCAVQCLTCGAAIREVSKSSPEVLRLATIDDYDPDLYERWRSARKDDWRANQARYQSDAIAARAERDADWQRWYAEYRATPDWQRRRGRVMQRAKGRCEGCGEALAVEVHHLTYAHAGNEFLFELVAVCRACHERIHGRETA